MKIAEARQVYQTQIKQCREQRALFEKQKTELNEKMNSVENGTTVYANEAATLELSMKTLDEKQSEYEKYMEQLLLQHTAIANMESSKQQGEAMAAYAEDLGKIMEVARRIMKGGIVPSTDEKKLMDYSMELYQAAKNMGAMTQRREKEEYDSLWDDEEETKSVEDPTEMADQTEAAGVAPAIVPVAELAQSSESIE